MGGVNTYTGPTAILGGAVCVAHGYNLGANEASVHFDGGSLQFTAPVDIQSNHPFVFGSGGGTVDTQGYDCSALADGWSGAGRFTKTGAGTFALGGSGSAFSGEVNLAQGVLRLSSNDVLSSCAAITVGAGATLDVAAVADYRLGTVSNQRLDGTGTIVGNLRIGRFATHDVGSSPGVQSVQGNYTMDGLLQLEISGAAPGNGVAGYAQVLVGGSRASDVSLSGSLTLAWSGTGWSADGDKLWIIRNDTAGDLQGTFIGYANGALVCAYDGRPWRIYYDADAASGQLNGGNDVLIMAGTHVPEPGSLMLLVLAGVAATAARGLGRRRRWQVML